MLQNFRFTKFKFYLKAIEFLHLPLYKGSTFRGGLGNVFKRTLCISRDKKCDDCVLLTKCAYSYCFETPAKDKGKARSSNWPHPYIIEPPSEAKTAYQKGEQIELRLILIGKGIDYLPYFVLVFDELGKHGIGKGRGKYLLERVTDNNEAPVYMSESHFLSDSYEIKTFDKIKEEISTFNSKRITLHFLAPTRIKYKGRLTKEPNFKILTETLLRRISALSFYHCGEHFGYSDLIEKAGSVSIIKSDLKWRDWERYSSRQNTRMKLGGFVGTITFEGNLREFMPFVKLGEYIHIGKQTSFGLGKYEIINTNNSGVL